MNSVWIAGKDKIWGEKLFPDDAGDYAWNFAGRGCGVEAGVWGSRGIGEGSGGGD